MRDFRSSPVLSGPPPAAQAVVDERLPWPGFTRREGDRLLFLRWLVRTGRLGGPGAPATRYGPRRGPARERCPMSSQASSPVAPDLPPSAGVAERDAVVAVGWRVEGATVGLRAVPYLLRGHPDWLLPDVRYAVLLTPAWRSPGTA